MVSLLYGPDFPEIASGSNSSRIGANHHAMTYTIGAGSSFNMVLSYVDNSDPGTWKSETTVEDMRREFSGWDPQ
jgi:salicylate hydroxylase